MQKVFYTRDFEIIYGTENKMNETEFFKTKVNVFKQIWKIQFKFDPSKTLLKYLICL